MSDIHLGFEVGTGEAISIPLRHLIITGQTRLSGKTTTLDAITHRSGLRALTFLTKPGEETFEGARRIPPYFHDQGGWRFTASVLEATMGEKLKRERAEIINASKGTNSLREVYQRVTEKKANIRDGFVKDVLTGLEAYLEIVLPQLERTRFANSLELGPGVNLIDMSGSGWSDELRALVIRSALEWILRKEKGVFTVIPEAWQFIPEGRGNPVKQGCENLIRMGGVHSNWVGIDSQEITAVDKGIAKSCGVWILGVQRELNEVKRVIAQLPGRPKPTPDEVMSLGLGEFFVAYTGAQTHKVYVQPARMEEDAARKIARGEIEAHRVPRPKVRKEDVEEEMPSEEMKELNRKFDLLLDRLAPAQMPQPSHAPQTMLNSGASDEDALFERFRARLLRDPAVLKVLAQQPEITVETERYEITMDGQSLKGRIAVLIARGFFDAPQTASSTRKELKRTGADSPETNISRVFDEYLKMGFFTRDQKAFQAVKEMKRNVRQAASARALAG
jgi:hypothetical protein